MSILPDREQLLGVIGGHDISVRAGEMACLLGRAIVDAGYKLVTGGRRGAGERASYGAAAHCTEHGLDVTEHVFAVVPWGDEPDFTNCRILHAGKDKFERGMVLMNRTRTVFVVGGRKGTEHEIMHAAVDDYMAWGTAKIMPVSGTGGVAERILKRSHRYSDKLLDSSQPSSEKAKRLVESIEEYRFELFRFWDVDIHDGWLSGKEHPVVCRTYRIRHWGKNSGQGPIKVEGDQDD